MVCIWRCHHINLPVNEFCPFTAWQSINIFNGINSFFGNGSFILPFFIKRRKAETKPTRGFRFNINKKADDGNRTRDLRLTKATLYRLSHISVFHTRLLIYFEFSVLSSRNLKLFRFFYKVISTSAPTISVGTEISA